MVLVFIGAQCQAAVPQGLSLWQGSFPGPLTLGTVRANMQHTCAQGEIGISLRNCHELAFATKRNPAITTTAESLTVSLLFFFLLFFKKRKEKGHIQKVQHSRLSGVIVQA